MGSVSALSIPPSLPMADVMVSTFYLSLPKSVLERDLSPSAERNDRVEQLETALLNRLTDGYRLLRWAITRIDQETLWCEGAYIKYRAPIGQ